MKKLFFIPLLLEINDLVVLKRYKLMVCFEEN